MRVAHRFDLPTIDAICQAKRKARRFVSALLSSLVDAILLSSAPGWLTC